MAASVQGAQSFSRSIAILQRIADAGRPVSRAELVTLSGLTRPTLYRIVASLEAEGLIEAAGENRYRIGGRVIGMARAALAQNDVRKIAEPFLTRLRDATGETVHLAIRSGDALVYIDKIESEEAVRMTSTIGTRVMFHSTSVGKAFLAAMPAEAADAVIDRIALPAQTAFTTTDRGALKAIVRRAKQNGFVCDEEENEVGIVCYGAAICEGSERPVASISVSIPLFRRDVAERYTTPLIEAVTEISRRLGRIDTTD